MGSVSPSAENTSVWTMYIRKTLHSVDPNKNRFRFFVVELWSPPVGQGAAIRKRWGRIGTSGQSEVLYFDGLEGADHYFDVLVKRRYKRGYTEVETPKWSLLASEAEMEAQLRRLRRRLFGETTTLADEHEKRGQLTLDLAC